MSYVWGTTIKPIATFDGQLHVDEDKKIWEWDATSRAWSKMINYDFREASYIKIRNQNLNAAGNVFARTQDLVLNEWDDIYSKSFYEIETEGAPNIYRVAHLTKAELSIWLRDNMPLGGGGLFLQNSIIKIYQVVDTQANMNRMYSFNALYGAMRGRNSYFGSSFRTNSGADPVSGTLSAFESYFNASNLARRLVQYFWTEDPGAIDNRSLWFSWNSKDAYKVPRINSYKRIESVSANRHAYELGSGATVAPLGTYEYTGGNADVAYLVGEPGQIQILSGSEIRGLEYFKELHPWCVVLPMQLTINTDWKAFLIKPYGISHAVIGADQKYDPNTTDWRVVCENIYGGGEKNYRHKVFDPVNTEFRYSGIRFQAKAALKKSGANILGPDTGLDSDACPSYLKFYLNNITTGLRTNFSSTSLQIVRRKNFIPIQILERRQRL